MMFKWLIQAVLNDDERDTTKVPKHSLNTILHYFLNFYCGVMFEFNQLELFFMYPLYYNVRMCSLCI